MYTGSKDSLKDELRWKKVIQRRLLDSGHDGKSVRLLGVAACLALLLILSLIAAVVHSMDGRVLNSFLDAKTASYTYPEFERGSSDLKVKADVSANKEIDSKILLQANNTDNLSEVKVEKSEIKPMQVLPGNSAEEERNLDDDIQMAFQKECTLAPVVLFSKSFCPFCTEIKKILLPYNAEGERLVNVIELDKHPNGRLLLDGIEQVVGRRSVPQTFIGGEYFGGLRKVKEAEESGELAKLVFAAR